ncbi:hypothetical protein AVEN_250276-1 [Araneus ventricosus]|uniref:Uncharacterized protein n=1 Tax=Araneus ventricosus TaxID=182803 RepID=A0A4Y2SLS9_ARAVE|nr:hypothetical protein AVEN_184597-1 [Araneus ventricosus]GBN88102.1 hypothetical protein AVEN_4753-1 [Araneus ventricosus]GBN88122.1 hypothetical protein AVEN_250276-1 [Araneus ventricosus]
MFQQSPCCHYLQIPSGEKASIPAVLWNHRHPANVSFSRVACLLLAIDHLNMNDVRDSPNTMEPCPAFQSFIPVIPSTSYCQ